MAAASTVTCLTRLSTRLARRLEHEAGVRRGAREVRAQAPRSLDAALDYAYTAKPGGFELEPMQLRHSGSN